MLRKLIVTDRTALLRKYGAHGWRAIQESLQVLVAADDRRGVATQLAMLDPPGSPAASRRSGGAREAACKQAIDHLYRSARAPDYLLLLGGPDVIPHQSLRNPIVNDEDVDVLVPSDLPYACDAPYSRAAADFVGPTRVVGRLPDIVGARDPALLCRLIENAATFVGAPNRRVFAVSAAYWQQASRENLRLAFASRPTCHLSPPEGPAWPASALHAPLQFFNLHGADTDPDFYGQPADGKQQFPRALQASALAGRIRAGTVAAAECCYGAQLYRPRVGIPPGMAQTYLAEGAGAFMGSSNIAFGAFGPDGADRRCNADVLCTDFMAAIRSGASTGRALLQARQSYVQRIGHQALDVFDLKTLGQFLLLGDPSLRPMGGRERRVVMSQPPLAAHRRRRARLKAVGRQLKRTVRSATRVSKVAAGARDALASMLTRQGLRPGKAVRFTVPRTRQAGGTGDARPDSSDRVIVMFARDTRARRAVRDLTAVIARVVNGNVVDCRTVKAR